MIDAFLFKKIIQIQISMSPFIHPCGNPAWLLSAWGIPPPTSHAWVWLLSQVFTFLSSPNPAADLLIWGHLPNWSLYFENCLPSFLSFGWATVFAVRKGFPRIFVVKLFVFFLRFADRAIIFVCSWRTISLHHTLNWKGKLLRSSPSNSRHPEIPAFCYGWWYSRKKVYLVFFIEFGWEW